MLKTGETHFFGQVAQKALIFKDGKILLVQYPQQEKHENARGKWDMPGGRLNQDESVLPGLKREVFEEIGAEIVVKKILATGTFVNLDSKSVFFVIYKASLVDENKSFVLEEGEIGKVAWVEVKEFFNLPMIYPEYQEVLKTVLGAEGGI